MKAKKVLAIGASTMLMVTGSFILSGCDAVSSIVGSNPITDAMSTTKKTAADDYKNYKVIDPPPLDGGDYVTVAYFEQDGTKGFDADKFKSMLNDNNVVWYQLIASSSMGTQQQQYGYLFMPASSTYENVRDVVNLMKGTFTGHVCTTEEYEKYMKSKNNGTGIDTDIYHNETTHYGPAAQQQK